MSANQGRSYFDWALAISLATALSGCVIADPYNAGTLNLNIVRFAFFTNETPPTGRNLRESDLPFPVKEFNVERDRHIYFVFGLDRPQEDVSVRIIWYDPQGRAYRTDSRLFSYAYCPTCLWRMIFPHVLTEQIVNLPGEWRVEAFAKNNHVGTYKFKLISPKMAQLESISQPAFPLSVVAAANTVREGNAKKALSYYVSLAEAFSKQGHTYNTGFAYVLASTVALYSGDYQTAINYAQKGLETAKGLKDHPDLLYEAYVKLVLAFHEIGEFGKVRFYANLMKNIALENQTLSSWHRQLADSYRYLAWAETGLNDYDSAIGNLIKAKELYEKLLNWERKGPSIEISNYFRCLGALGEAYFNQGNIAEAKYYFKLVLDTARARRRRAPSLIPRIGLGLVALREGNLVEARQYLTDVLSSARSYARPIYVTRSLHGLGRTYMGLGEWKEAASFLKEAVNYTEDMRSSLKSGELRQTFLEGKISAYSDLVISLSSTGENAEAFHYAERGRARAFLDLLGTKGQFPFGRVSGLVDEERRLRERLAAVQFGEEGDEEQEIQQSQVEQARKEYNEFLAKLRKENAEQASLVTVEPFDVKQAQDLLDPGQTLLEYFVTPDKTFLWIVSKERFHALSISIPKGDLAVKINSLRKAVSTIQSLKEYQTIAGELYRLLIQPALPYVSGRELIVIPHDVLHYLPFHALISPKGRYLIEDYPIYYLSSASLLQFVKEKKKAKGERVLAFGNPDLGDPNKDLQFAELETREVQKLYPQSTVLLRKEATEERSKALSPQHDILHFATHAELKEEDPLSSAILLAKDGKEDGRLEVREIFGIDLKASLVVLSACETGLGKLSTGDELVGLTRAFIYAGTPSVVASLWKVEDDTTAALMASFYKNLRTMSKVEALRQAQLELIRGEGGAELLAKRGVGGIGKLGTTPAPKPQSQTSLPSSISVSTSHPYFWAPFILVGDGR